MTEPDTSLNNKINGPKSRIRLTLPSVWLEKNTYSQASSTVKAEEDREYWTPQLSGLFWEYFIHLITVNVLETFLCYILLCLPMLFLSDKWELLKTGITCKLPSKSYRRCEFLESAKVSGITLAFKIIEMPLNTFNVPQYEKARSVLVLIINIMIAVHSEMVKKSTLFHSQLLISVWNHSKTVSKSCE